MKFLVQLSFKGSCRSLIFFGLTARYTFVLFGGSHSYSRVNGGDMGSRDPGLFTPPKQAVPKGVFMQGCFAFSLLTCLKWPGTLVQPVILGRLKRLQYVFHISS